MQVEFTLADASFTITLLDGTTARDLAARLPLTLTLRDFHRTEKIADLPERLSTTGEPDGAEPGVGDLTYYAPWGNLALFYRDFGYSNGLVKLGTIDGDPSVLARIKDGQRVTVTLLG